MENKLKPCPFCGNEQLKIEVVGSRYDILADALNAIIDIRCTECRTIKGASVIGIAEEDCVKEAVRLWNRRVNNERNTN